MAYGLTPEGFIPKTFEICREEVNTSLQGTFGVGLNVSDESPMGEFAAIMCEREANLWELGEAIYHSQDPRAATDAALESLSAITGTTKEAAAPSTVILTLTGDDTTVINEGSRASVTGTSNEFQTDEDVTLEALNAWVALTAYVVDDRVTNAGRAYVCIDPGTSDSSGGPTTDDDSIVDATVLWRYIGEGEAAADVESRSVELAPISAISGSIIVIETPVAGWLSVMNLLDAELGRDVESNAELRVRREEELANPGTTPVDAIRADLLDIPDVISVTVFQNTADTTDVDGMPPHSVEALIRGGDDTDIFEQLLASVAGGIKTHGTET